MRENFKGRLNLSEKASQSLLFMVQQLKEENPHLQINPSKLCSWVIENYVRDHFSGDTKKIVETYFNPKRYLTEMLKTAKTEDEIKTLFQNAMSHFDGRALPSVPKKRKTSKTTEGLAEPASIEKPNLTGGQ